MFSDFLFPAFEYGFRSSQSTADLLTVASGRTARAFIRSWTTFNRILHAGLLHKLHFYGISG